MAKRITEIERKWLVSTPPPLTNLEGRKIIQGYIAVCADGTEVRLRQKGKSFFQTIKTGHGLKRGEIETELSEKQFKTLWPGTEGRRLEKLRYVIEWSGYQIELDLYQKNLRGLVLAEVEFKSLERAERFSPPQWFGKEVTNDKRYKNASLAARANPSLKI
jgi:adenylate cyclase